MREFLVTEGRERDFEGVFGLGGIWSELLHRSPLYLGSELRLESVADRRYRVCDYWRSHEDFEGFREQYQPEYEKFTRLIASEDLVEREVLLGSFYQDDPGFEDGTDLVQA